MIPYRKPVAESAKQDCNSQDFAFYEVMSRDLLEYAVDIPGY